MTKEHTDHHKKHHKHNTGIQEEEKLFDFNKSFQDDPESTSSENREDEQISAFETSIAELKEKNLRLLAEFENYKKRTMRERLDLLNSASKDVIISLLPVLDDFDRAKKHAEEFPEEQFSEGVRLVYNRLYTILQSLGVKAMESVGEAFDPELHEAITEVPAPGENMRGKILDVIEKGYTLNDKIIRHAKVVVGK